MIVEKNFFSKKQLSLFLKNENIYLTKSKGQNFLLDLNIIRKIFSYINYTQNDLLIEIGGGIGHLTDFFFQNTHFKKLLIFELDKKLSAILKKRFEVYNNSFSFNILHQDYLTWSLQDYLIEENKINKYYEHIYMIGNLPYSCVGKILRNFIDNSKYIHKVFITIQKELALRIFATPENKKSYGFLSVLIQTFSTPTYHFDISNKVFFPIPKINSTFLSLDFTKNVKHKIKDVNFFIKFIKLLFLFRRKKILTILKMKGWEASILKKIPSVFLKHRVESLTRDDMIHLSNIVNKK